MINFSYSLSKQILEYEKLIMALRGKILTAVISPDTESYLRYQVFVNSHTDSLALSQIDTSPEEVDKTLHSYLMGMPYGRRNHPWLSKTEQATLDYNNAHKFIRETWFVSSEEVSSKTIVELHDLSSPGRLRSENILRQIVSFINAEKDPFIQSALALIIIPFMSPFTDGNGRTARLVSQLIFYKYGLDFRGFLNLNHFLRETHSSFVQFLQQAKSNSNLTLFLEHFLSGVERELGGSLNQIMTSDPQPKKNRHSLLPRQKRILLLFEIPDIEITNRQVQKAFKVSQITASRDLAKLVLLGFLFIHGKGRSVYYIRA